jgi:transposase InsO family protein
MEISTGGRPKVSREVISLIKQMANENSKWGAPRIHGELQKLGFDISESTVQRYMPKNGRRTTGQNWKTFLKNHSKEIISIDFLTVPTIHFKLVHVLVVIEHHRRKLIYFNVTKNPTAEWSLQQIRNLLFDYKAPRYLIRDRDMNYGTLLGGKKNSFGIDEIVTAYRSPWQNGYVERIIGSIKRECLDHVIVLNENHLRSILTDYISYYNKYRTHLGINKDSPEGRQVQLTGKIDKIPMVNGHHHYYFRQAA